jgi:hypothetical protein
LSIRHQRPLDRICQYAFSTETLAASARFRGVFEPCKVPRFAYHTYDCVATSEGPGFTDLDFLVCAGLDARVAMRSFARLRSFADRASGYLDRAHRTQPEFLRLAPDAVSDSPAEGTAGWYLYKAWQQGVATPELSIARVHKVLHHKHPRLVPLLTARRRIGPAQAKQPAPCAMGCLGSSALERALQPCY